MAGDNTQSLLQQLQKKTAKLVLATLDEYLQLYFDVRFPCKNTFLTFLCFTFLFHKEQVQKSTLSYFLLLH